MAEGKKLILGMPPVVLGVVVLLVIVLIVATILYLKSESERKKLEAESQSRVRALTENPCSVRQPGDYNVQHLGTESYVCPQNFTVMDGYPPGGLTGPRCHMNTGAQLPDGRTTPSECGNNLTDCPATRMVDNPEGCKIDFPCGKAQGVNGANIDCFNYYGQWWVTSAVPLANAGLP